jgi:hypothetical protein
MSDKRQKNLLVLAFMEEGRGEPPSTSQEGTESLTAKREVESPAIGERLMEEVCERENCKQALARVQANKGSPGVDGMIVHELPGYLKHHWPVIREQLLHGTYKPQPVKTGGNTQTGRRGEEVRHPDGQGRLHLCIGRLWDGQKSPIPSTRCVVGDLKFSRNGG